MEVMAMSSSQHTYDDPAYSGQAPNMFLTSVGRQQRSDQQPNPFAVPGTQFSAHGPGPLSSHSTEMSEENMDSPHMSNVSWPDFAATSWEEHARMLEQQGHGARAMHMPVNSIRFGSGLSNSNFSAGGHGVMPTPMSVSNSAAMDFTMSTSASPGPEVSAIRQSNLFGPETKAIKQLLAQETFTSPLTPSSFGPEGQSLQDRASLPLTRHRHIRSTPSPSHASDSPELARRRSAPTQVKGVTSGSTKVNKSNSKSGASQAPANSRSAHSAIERKYRENINSKIMELHKVLCSATPPLFQDPEGDSSGYPYARMPRPDDEDADGVDGSGNAGQTTLPAKKADVLAGAVSYVRRSEREKRALMERLTAATQRLQQYEQAMAQARAHGMGGG